MKKITPAIACERSSSERTTFSIDIKLAFCLRYHQERRDKAAGQAETLGQNHQVAGVVPGEVYDEDNLAEAHEDHQEACGVRLKDRTCMVL